MNAPTAGNVPFRGLQVLILVTGVLIAAAGQAAEGSGGEPWHGLGLNIDGRKEYDEHAGYEYYVFYQGPEVWSVTPGGPAHQAGILRWDRLTHINGVSLVTPEGGRLFSSLMPGERIQVIFERDGEVHETSWVVGDREIRTTAHGRSESAGAGDGTPAPVPDDDPSGGDDQDHLCYAGSHWGADVEVRCADDVIVTLNKERREILIVSGEMIVSVRRID